MELSWNFIFTVSGNPDQGPWPFIVCINHDLWLTLTYFMARSNMITYAFLLAKVETLDFSESFVNCDLESDRYRLLITLKKVCEYLRSGSFLDLGQWSFTY